MKQSELIEELRLALDESNKRVSFYQLKWLATLNGGVYTSAKAIQRLKRRVDLKQEYILAAEELFKVLEVFAHDASALPPAARQAIMRMQEKREQNGLRRRKKVFKPDGTVIVKQEFEDS